MRLIDTTYFVGPLFLSNITTESGQVSEKTLFETFITNKEVEYLESYFGYELAKIIIAALDAYTTSSTPIPTRLLAIIDGAEFTDIAGNLQKWKGLRRTDKSSPIADYVYYYWRRDKVTTTAQGESIPEVENSIQVGPWEKVRTNWLHGVKENIILFDFMRANISDYPEYQLYAFDQYNRRNLMTPLSLF